MTMASYLRMKTFQMVYGKVYTKNLIRMEIWREINYERKKRGKAFLYYQNGKNEEQVIKMINSMDPYLLV